MMTVMQGRPLLRLALGLLLVSLWTTTSDGTYGTSKSKPPEIPNNPNPMIYTRWRFDHQFLQIYRRFMKYERDDETKLTFKFNETRDNNRTELVKVTYYENRQFLSNLTQDDLIFEALERAYLTRLFPAYLYNYDKKSDIKKATDSKKLDGTKCKREFAYLMDMLTLYSQERDNRQTFSWSPELAVFFDSMAAEEPGILMGNYHWTGNWRQCHKRHIFHMANNNESWGPLSFTGRHCIASIRSKNWAERSASRLDDLEEKHFKYDYQRYDYQRFFRIQVGICLPESCDSSIIDTNRDDIHRLATFKLSEMMKQYELADLYCLPDETSELRKFELGTILFIVVASIWLSCIALATAIDQRGQAKRSKAALAAGGKVKLPPTTMDKLVSSLSVIRNFDRLVETRSCQPKPELSAEQRAALAASGKLLPLDRRNRLEPNDLLFMNFLKVLTMPLVMFGHSCMMYKHMDKYVLDYEALETDVWFHFQASTPFYVDWFFTISGFLTTYLMFVTNKVATNTPIQWLYTIFHRYWRLMPLYFIIFWFSKSVLMYTGSGPLWDYATNNMTIRSICRRESYLNPILLISNFHALHEECILPAWYVACDMQFYLFTPLLLVLLHKSPAAGWIVGWAGFIACSAARAYSYWTDKKSLLLELMRPRYDLYVRNNWDMHYTYVQPQHRVASYLVGVLAGHYTYMVLSGRWKSPLYDGFRKTGSRLAPDKGPAQLDGGQNNNNNNNKNRSNRRHPHSAARLGFLSGLNWPRMLVFFFGLYVSIQGGWGSYIIAEWVPPGMEHHIKLLGTFFYTMAYTMMGVGMSLFVMTVTFGQFRWLRDWMSMPIWTVISRINFVVFLIQVEVFYYLTQADNVAPELSPIGSIKVFFALACVTLALAPVIVVLLELPLAQLERNFVGPYFISNKRTQHQDSMRRHLQQAHEPALDVIQQPSAANTESASPNSAEMVQLTSSPGARPVSC